MKNFEKMYSWVKNLPIIDWHNHLDMQMLADDKPLGSLYEVWVKSDPYKHRAMRICGEPERLITGDAGEDEKWAAWMRTLPKLVGNPLFAWAKMEMEWLRGFNAEKQRGGEAEGSCGWLRELENVSLSDWTPSKMLKAFNVEYISPCVVPGEILTGLTGFTGLERNVLKNPVNLVNPVKKDLEVVPSLRFNAGDEVTQEMLKKLHAAGCRVVDVSVDDVGNIPLRSSSTIDNRRPTSVRQSTCDFWGVAAFAAAHGWTMLLHLGALRETSARLRAVAGPAGGFAGMRAPVDPVSVAALLDKLERTPNVFLRHKEHEVAFASGSLGVLENRRNTRELQDSKTPSSESNSTCSTRLNNPDNPVNPVNPVKKNQDALREEALAHYRELLESMGRLGIRLLCYNFMVGRGWSRTGVREGRGGARATCFSLKMAAEPDSLCLSADQIWENYECFIRAVMPVAEKNGVRMGLHPDDPCLPSLGGYSRIFGSVEAFDRAYAIYPSPSNAVTFCQANFKLMFGDGGREAGNCFTEELIGAIRHFDRRIAFIHVRDVEGTKEDFTELFHDQGDTDQFALMRVYRELGIDVPVRGDHVPEMAFDRDLTPEGTPGYFTLGRLFANGYLKALLKGTGNAGYGKF